MNDNRPPEPSEPAMRDAELVRARIRALLSDEGCEACDAEICAKHMTRAEQWALMLIAGAAVGWMLAQLGFSGTRSISEWLCCGAAVTGTALLHYGRLRRRRLSRPVEADPRV